MSIETDLENRDYWRRYLRERSLETLSDRFGISKSAVWLREVRPLACLTDEENTELKTLRDEYHEALIFEMPRHRLTAIAKRNGVTTKTVCMHQQKMIMEKADRVYEQKVAA